VWEHDLEVLSLKYIKSFHFIKFKLRNNPTPKEKLI